MYWICSKCYDNIIKTCGEQELLTIGNTIHENCCMCGSESDDCYCMRTLPLLCDFILWVRNKKSSSNEVKADTPNDIADLFEIYRIEKGCTIEDAIYKIKDVLIRSNFINGD